VGDPSGCPPEIRVPPSAPVDTGCHAPDLFLLAPLGGRVGFVRSGIRAIVCRPQPFRSNMRCTVEGGTGRPTAFSTSAWMVRKSTTPYGWAASRTRRSRACSSLRLSR